MPVNVGAGGALGAIGVDVVFDPHAGIARHRKITVHFPICMLLSLNLLCVRRDYPQ
jgi:hypothetical protein